MNVRAIRVENLGKKYRIGASKAAYGTLRESITNSVKAPARRAYGRLRHGRNPESRQREIWALKDVSFEINRGEVVGVIGRNGAGKSTLLKTLSRITKPTRGTADVYGRVGSLLEVGTGFNMELSGRENVYLNGAILGMKRAEIARKFDEIVAFSGIEVFIDTPVKHYSSGMYLRLAFAVAAHLESEILLVDEVLAVGDAEFQQKCLGKMGSIASEGRTILFVSHNMSAVRALCTRAMWIDNGTIQLDGNVAHVAGEYLRRYQLTPSQTEWQPEVRPRNESMELRGIRLADNQLESVSEVRISEDVVIEIEYSITRDETRPLFSLLLLDDAGELVFSSLSNVDTNPVHGKRLAEGIYRSHCRIYGDLLNEGRYTVSLLAMTVDRQDALRIDNAVTFTAVDDGVLKGDYPGRFGGAVRPRLDWRVEMDVKPE